MSTYKITYEVDSYEEYRRVLSVVEVMAERGDRPAYVHAEIIPDEDDPEPFLEGVHPEFEEEPTQLVETWEDWKCSNPKCQLCEED